MHFVELLVRVVSIRSRSTGKLDCFGDDLRYIFVFFRMLGGTEIRACVSLRSSSRNSHIFHVKMDFRP